MVVALVDKLKLSSPTLAITAEAVAFSQYTCRPLSYRLVLWLPATDHHSNNSNWQFASIHCCFLVGPCIPASVGHLRIVLLWRVWHLCPTTLHTMGKVRQRRRLAAGCPERKRMKSEQLIKWCNNEKRLKQANGGGTRQKYQRKNLWYSRDAPPHPQRSLTTNRVVKEWLNLETMCHKFQAVNYKQLNIRSDRSSSSDTMWVMF